MNSVVLVRVFYLQRSSYYTEYATGDNVHELFDESKNRVSAMALIHEKLYQSKDLVKIDLNEYLSGLTEIHEQR